MLAYYILFAVIILQMCLEKVALRYSFDKKHPYWHAVIFKNKTILILLFVIFATIKDYSVGIDNKYYSKYFANVVSSGNIYNYNFGYFVLNYFIRLVGMPINILYFVVELFTIIVFIKLVNEFCENKYIPLLLFLALGMYAQSISLYRQIIAVDFCILGILALKKNNLYHFIACILMGFLFHSSAIVGFLFIIPKYLKLNYKTLIVAGCLMLGIAALFIPILKLLEAVVPGFNYYSHYVVTGKFAGGTNIDILYTIGLSLILCFSLYMYFKYKQNIAHNKRDEMVLFIWMFAFLIFTKIIGIAYGFESLLNRTSIYFFFSIIILQDMCGKLIEKNNIRTIYNVAIIIVSLVYMIFLYQFKGSCGVYPYSFIGG